MWIEAAQGVLAPKAIEIAFRIADVLSDGALGRPLRKLQQWLSDGENKIMFREALERALNALYRSGFAIEGPGALDVSLLLHEEVVERLWSPLLDDRCDDAIDIEALVDLYNQIVWQDSDGFPESLKARQQEGMRFLIDVLYDEILWNFSHFEQRLAQHILRELGGYVSQAKQQFVIRQYLEQEQRFIARRQSKDLGGGRYLDPILELLVDEPKREEEFRQIPSAIPACEVAGCRLRVSADINEHLVRGRDPRVAVVADSGYGKTVLLQEVFLRCARSWQQGNPVPFLFTPDQAAACNEGTLASILSTRLTPAEDARRNTYVHVREAQRRSMVATLESRGDLLFLFDALDQVRADQQLVGLLDRAGMANRNRIIASMRPGAWSMSKKPLGSYAHIRLREFDRKMRREFFGTLERSPLLKQLSKDLLEIPYYAFQVRSILEESGTGLERIENRSDLFNAFIHRLPTRDQDLRLLGSQSECEDAILAMRSLAFESLKRNHLNDGISRDEGQRLIGDKDLLNLERVQFVVRYLETGSKLFFRHRSIQEYLAAEALLQLWRESGNVSVLDPYVFHPKWEEPIRFLAGLIEDPDRLEALITRFLEADPSLPLVLYHDHLRLACLCLHEATMECPEASEGLMRRIEQLFLGDQEAALALLVQWGRSPALSLLAGQLRAENKGLASRSALAFGKIGASDQKVLGALIEALKDKALAQEAARALGAIGASDQKVLDALIEALKAEDKRLAWRSASALEQIGASDQKVLGALIEALKVEDKRLAWRSASALRGIAANDQKVLDALVEALKDKALAREAARALGAIGSSDQKVLDGLIETLNAEDQELATASACSLVKTGSSDQKVLDSLIEALKAEDKRLAWRSASVLGTIGSSDQEVLDALIEAVKTENERLSRSAARALGEIGSSDQKVLDALIEALKDKALAWEATWALREIGPSDQEVLDALIKALKAEDKRLACRSASALGTIGAHDQKVLNALIEALKAKDRRLARRSASALRKIRSSDQKVLEALIEALKADDMRLACRTASALGTIGSSDQKVLDALIEAVQAGHERLSRSAASALGTIGASDQKVLDALIEAVQAGHERLSRSAASALGTIGASDQKVLDALVEAVQAGHERLSRSAASALGEIGSSDQKVLYALTEALKAEDRGLSRIASSALGKIRSIDEKALSALIEALEGEDQELARTTAWSLGEIGLPDQQVLSALIEALKAEDKELARGVASALGKIRSTNQRVLDALVEVLRREACILDWAVLRMLRGSVAGQKKSADSSVKGLLEEGDISLERAIPLAREMLGVGENDFHDALVKELNRGNQRLATNAISALEKIGSSESNVLEALIHVVKCGDEMLAESAASALEKIGSSEKEVLHVLAEVTRAQRNGAPRSLLDTLKRVDLHWRTQAIPARLRCQ